MLVFTTVYLREMPSQQRFFEALGPTRSPPAVISREEHSGLDTWWCCSELLPAERIKEAGYLSLFSNGIEGEVPPSWLLVGL